MQSSNQVGHGGLFENVLFGLSMFTVTTRRDKDRKAIGHVCHEFPVASGLRLEAGWTVGLKWGMGVGDRGCVEGKWMGIG
jgi:hypothetical protein